MEGRDVRELSRPGNHDRDATDPVTDPWELALDSGRLDWIWDTGLTGQGYTSTDLDTLSRVLARPCPHCHADIGEWCHNTGSGEPLCHLDRQHVARRGLIR